MAPSQRNSKFHARPSNTSVTAAVGSTIDQSGPRYTFVTHESLDEYQVALRRSAREQRLEFKWVADLLDLWAIWSSGGSGLKLRAYDEYHDSPRSTALDVNGTAFDDRMLQVEAAYAQLLQASPKHAKAIFEVHRTTAGTKATAIKLGITERALPGVLNVGYRFIASVLKAR